MIVLNGASNAFLIISNHAFSSGVLPVFFSSLAHLNNAVPAHSTTPSSIADLVAFNESSILYLISCCSVSDEPPTLILAIFPLILPNLSFNFSILKGSFSFDNNAFILSILPETLPFPPVIIVYSFHTVTFLHVPVSSIVASSSDTASPSQTTVAPTRAAISCIVSS